MNGYEAQACHTKARLEQVCEGLTGEALEQELLRITESEQYSVFTGFEYEPVDVSNDEAVGNASYIDLLLTRSSRYTSGMDKTDLIDSLSEALTRQVRRLYPDYDVVDARFMDYANGLAWIDITFRDIVEAARFCFEYTDGTVPKGYTVDTLLSNDLFWSTVVEGFNRGTAANRVLGLCES